MFSKANLERRRGLVRLDGMGKQADECRKRAAECERMVILAIEPEKRAMYAQLAAQWREMSEQAEWFDRRHSAGSRA